MTFDELKLLVAVRAAEPGGKDCVTDQSRQRLCRTIAEAYQNLTRDVLFPYSTDEVVAMYYRYRKSGDTKTKADIAIAHRSFDCFWLERGKGPCSDEVEAGHLVPRCKGGPLTVENCIIECRAHNNQRREKTIEEYLLSNDRT